MTTTKQRAAFLAALTATDQMPPAERQRMVDDARRAAKSKARTDRYPLWMEAVAAYHDAAAAYHRACVANARDMADKRARQAAHDAACRAMLDAFTRLMASPLVGKSDAKERRVMIGKGRGTIAHSLIRHAYMAATAEWLAHIEADAARFGRR